MITEKEESIKEELQGKEQTATSVGYSDWVSI